MGVTHTNDDAGCGIRELVRFPLLLKSGGRFSFCLLLNFVAGLFQVDLKSVCAWIETPVHPALLILATPISFIFGVGCVYFALHTRYLLRAQAKRAVALFYASSVLAMLAGIWCRLLFATPEKCPSIVIGAPIDWRAVVAAFIGASAAASVIAAGITAVFGTGNYAEARSSLRKFIKESSSDGATFSAPPGAALPFVFDAQRLSKLTADLKTACEGMKKLAAGEPAGYSAFVERVIHDAEQLLAYAGSSVEVGAPHRFLQACGVAPIGSVPAQERKENSRAYACLARIANA